MAKASRRGKANHLLAGQNISETRTDLSFVHNRLVSQLRLLEAGFAAKAQERKQGWSNQNISHQKFHIENP